MNVSNTSLRRQAILEALDKCDSRDTRESLLLDKVLELQDTLFEMQSAYCELTISYNRLRSTELDQNVHTTYCYKK